MLAIVAGLALAGRGWWEAMSTGLIAIVALYSLGMGSFMLHWSRVTKLRERERLLDLVPWRGDEVVLDVGCGRGLLLVGAARRLSTGRAIGIDIWQAEDQSRNSADGVRENAEIEGVADRVEVRTADMRALPFDDAVIDVVVSHWAVHNLDDEDDAYAQHLRHLGLTEQRLIVAPLRDTILNLVSFGSFRPAAILAARP